MKQALFIILTLLCILINRQNVNGQSAATRFDYDFKGSSSHLYYKITSDTTVDCIIYIENLSYLGEEYIGLDTLNLQDTCEYYKVKTIKQIYPYYGISGSGIDGVRPLRVNITVDIPASVDSIYSSTFNNELTDDGWNITFLVRIPSDSQLKYIVDKAFANASVDFLSNTITYVGEDAIDTKYAGVSNGPWYIGKCLYKYRGKIPVNSSFRVAEGTLNISPRAFEGQRVSQITLPKSLIGIGAEAFRDCTNLQEVTFNKSLKFIGQAAFCGCTSLKAISFPSSLETIGNGAFSGCTSIEELTTLPASLLKIGGHAFNNCANLKRIIIPKSVKDIGLEAFWYVFRSV